MLKKKPLSEPKMLPTDTDLCYFAISDAIKILGKDEHSWWTLTVPSQLLEEAHELAQCFGMSVRMSTWMGPEAWQITKTKWAHAPLGEVREKLETSVGSRGA